MTQIVRALKLKDLKNILIILLGPAGSLYAIIAGKNFKIKSAYFLYVGVGASIALIASIISHLIIKNNLKKANIISVIASELIYVFIVIIVSVGKPEEMMWLPVVLLFLPVFSLPTALSVSIGVGGLMKRDKKL